MRTMTLPMFFTLVAVILGAMAINYFVGNFGLP